MLPSLRLCKPLAPQITRAGSGVATIHLVTTDFSPWESNNTVHLGILLERYAMLLFGVCTKYLKNEEKAWHQHRNKFRRYKMLPSLRLCKALAPQFSRAGSGVATIHLVTTDFSPWQSGKNNGAHPAKKFGALLGCSHQNHNPIVRIFASALWILTPQHILQKTTGLAAPNPTLPAVNRRRIVAGL
jgi:hypothetical protein